MSRRDEREREFEDVEETAQRVGLSPGAVRNRSMRALQRLRGLIDSAPEPAEPEGADHVRP